MNVTACIIGLPLIFWITVLRRSPGERIIYVVPFYAFYLAKRQRELYRELLMNVFLFVPVGLTLPYAVEITSALFVKHKKGQKNKASTSDLYKQGSGRKGSLGSRYADIMDAQSCRSRKRILQKIMNLDGSCLTGRLKIIGCSILFATMVSFCIEFLQALFALGTAEVDDVIMNTLGAAIGCCPFLVRLGERKDS